MNSIVANLKINYETEFSFLHITERIKELSISTIKIWMLSKRISVDSSEIPYSY